MMPSSTACPGPEHEQRQLTPGCAPCCVVRPLTRGHALASAQALVAGGSRKNIQASAAQSTKVANRPAINGASTTGGKLRWACGAKSKSLAWACGGAPSAGATRCDACLAPAITARAASSTERASAPRAQLGTPERRRCCEAAVAGRSATSASSSPYVRAENSAPSRSSSSSASSRPSAVAWRRRSAISSRSESDALSADRLATTARLARDSVSGKGTRSCSIRIPRHLRQMRRRRARRSEPVVWAPRHFRPSPRRAGFAAGDVFAVWPVVEAPARRFGARGIGSPEAASSDSPPSPTGAAAPCGSRPWLTDGPCQCRTEGRHYWS